MLKVPLTAQLSYIWVRATGRDRIYSHLFHEKSVEDVLHDVKDEVAYRRYAHNFHWAHACPVNKAAPEEDRRYLVSVFNYSCRSTFGLMADGVLERQDYPREHTREEAMQFIARIENGYMGAGYAPTRHQPFAGGIRTVLDR